MKIKAQVKLLKKRMEQLANGHFEYRMPELILSEKEIVLTLPPGENYQGELYLGTEENRKIRGFANSTHRRLVPGMTEFAGTSVRMPYGVDVIGLAAGDAFDGEIVFSTEIGEYMVPFHIRIENEAAEEQMPEIRSLASFTELAKRDFREACRLFEGEKFRERIIGETPRGQALYLGMRQSPAACQQLEEFLIGAGEKEPVHIHLRETNAAYYEVSENIRESLTLQRSGWGHMRLEVRCTGDFLEPEKRMLNEEDFIGSTCTLHYLIRPEKLGRGRHFGRIEILGPYETLQFEVLVTRNREYKVNRNLIEKKLRLKLFAGCLEYRLERMTRAAWISEGMYTLDRLKEEGFDYPEYQFWRAFYQIEKGEMGSARLLMQNYREEMFREPELIGAYLYLCRRIGLLKNSGEIGERLERLCQKKRDSWLLLLMRSAVSEPLAPKEKLCRLEELFGLGCRSPFLYLAAWELWTEDPGRMLRINAFATQVFLFAAREQLHNVEVNRRFVYLCSYAKGFSEDVYRALAFCYPKQPRRETLEIICKYVMNGNPADSRYFPWYELAVQEDLRITRLYEYYMETRDENDMRPLPKILKLYFIYRNALSDRKKACIYENVILHKKEDPKSYAQYRDILREFAKRKLLEGKIDEHYAPIYREFAPELTGKDEAAQLAKLLFTCRLVCADPKICEIAVRHGQLAKEEIYPCSGGTAYPRIYTDDAVILFLDAKKRRYAATVDYRIEPLFDREELLREHPAADAEDTGLLLWKCRTETIREETVGLYRRLAAERAFSEKYRRHICRKLLNFYRENLSKEWVGKYLTPADCRVFEQIDRKVLLEILIGRGRYSDAYQIYGRGGGEGVPDECLLKLCSRRILATELLEDEELLALAWEVFCTGKYDEVILSYLLKYYIGPIDEMYRLWERAFAFALDTYDYEERLLKLLIFESDSRPQGARLLEHYEAQTGKREVVRAYLNFAAYGYFMKSLPMQPYIRKRLQEELERGGELDFICSLSLLQSYSAGKQWNDRQKELARQILKEAVARKLYFGFYRKLPAELLLPWQLDDRVFVEYRTDPRAKVTLYYALDNGLGREPEYKSEPLNGRCWGIFLKMFTLFYGETLHYYFVTEENGETKQSRESVISANLLDEKPQNKYQMLNRVLAARKLGKNAEAEKLLKEYLCRQSYVKAMYQIEKE